MDSAQGTPDYYEILKVDSTADLETIKKSYRGLARLKHPDKNLNNPGATAEFQKLEAAYSILSDPEKRKTYDLVYANIYRPHGQGHSFTSAPTNSRAPPTQPERSRHQGSSRQPRSSCPEPDVTPRERERLARALQVLCERHRALKINLDRAQMDFRAAEARFFQQRRDGEKEEQEDAQNDTWTGYFRSLTLSAEQRSRAKELRARRARQREHVLGLRATEMEHFDEKVDILFREMYDLEAEVEMARDQLDSADQRAPGRRERWAREQEKSRREREKRHAENTAHDDNERHNGVFDMDPSEERLPHDGTRR